MFSKSRSTPCSLVIVETSCCFHMWQMAEKNASPGTFWWVQVKLSLNGCKWPPTMMKLGDGLNHLAVWQLTWTRPKRLIFFWCSGYYHLLGSAQPPAGSILIGVSFIKERNSWCRVLSEMNSHPKNWTRETWTNKPSWAGKNWRVHGHKWLFHRK